MSGPPMGRCPLQCGLTGGCQACNLNYYPAPKADPMVRPQTYGWECRKCGAVMGPAMPVCVNCKGNVPERSER